MKTCAICEKEHGFKRPTCGADSCVKTYAKRKANARRISLIPDTADPAVRIRNRFILAGKLYS